MRSAFSVNDVSTRSIRALNYSPHIEAFRSKRGRLRSVRLGDLLSGCGPSYGTVFTRIDCQPEFGVELLSQKDMFATEPTGRVIRKDSMANPDRHRVEKWQIMLAGAGTLGENELFGRCIIADDRLEGKYVGPDAMVLTCREPGSNDNLYAYTFLCTEIGFRAIRASSYGTKVLRFRADVLTDLPVPEADTRTKATIAELVRKTVAGRSHYLMELNAARGLVEALPEMEEARRLSGDGGAKCLWWDRALKTLSARNHAYCGPALLHLQSRWKRTVADVTEDGGIFYGPHFTRVPCNAPFGVPLLSQRDVFMIRSVPRRIVRPAVRDRLLFVSDHCLLVAGHGQMNEGSLFGRVEIAECGMSRCAITQDILRVIPRAGEAELAFAYLSSHIGQKLLKSTAVGTSIPITRVDLVASLPFPEVSTEVWRKIVGHVRSAITARKEAEESEAQAVRIFEEEVLPAWLS